MTDRIYYLKNREQILEKNAEWKRNNMNRIREYQKEYYKNNRDRILEQCREYRKKNRQRIREYRREYYTKNREKIREYQRQYSRLHALTTGDKKVYGLIKRPMPDKCELCGRQVRRLVYHHFNDGELKKGAFVRGAWVCHFCHWFIERFEDNYVEKYLKLKERLLRDG